MALCCKQIFDELCKIEDLYDDDFRMFNRSVRYGVPEGDLYDLVVRLLHGGSSGEDDMSDDAVSEFFVTAARSAPPSEVFTWLFDLKRRLSEFSLREPEKSPIDLTVPIDLTEPAERAYETFLSEGSESSALRFLFQMEQLGQRIEVLAAFAKSLRSSAFAEDVEHSEGNAPLDLILSSEAPFKMLGRKINAIAVVYSEVASLMGVSEVEYPLRVGKIESGSLWVRVFGETRVITICEGLIRDAAAFLYGTFTKEGRLPRNVEEAEAVLQLRNQLEAAGIDTGRMDDQLQKAGFLIASNLNVIVAGEAQVEVNGVVIGVTDAAEARYLDASRVRLLDPGADSNGEDGH